MPLDSPHSSASVPTVQPCRSRNSRTRSAMTEPSASSTPLDTRSLAAPDAHWERFARKGFQLVYGSTANLFIDRHGDYIGYGPESRELVGLPDVDTFCILPWDPKTARVFCTLFRCPEEEVDPGAFLTS